MIPECLIYNDALSTIRFKNGIVQQSTSTSSLSFLLPSSLVHGIRELSTIQSISLMPHHRYAKRQKSQQSQVRQRREKRNFDTLYGGQVSINGLCAQTMCTPNCHEVHYYWHYNFDTYICNCNLNLEIITDSGSFLRLLAISIIFVNYMVEDLVVEWMWLDAVYEFCGGEVTTDTRMKMRRDIRLKHKTDFYFIPGWTFSCSLCNHLR